MFGVKKKKAITEAYEEPEYADITITERVSKISEVPFSVEDY